MPTCFADHVARLTRFVGRAPQISELIETRLLNVQGKAFSPDRARLAHALNVCFGEPRALDTLALAHAQRGFEIVPLGHDAHELDPVELIARAYAYWEHYRWPGRNGRLTFARAVYAACLLRQLDHLTMRVWDDGIHGAGERLSEVQQLLDALNAAVGAPVFVRDARWLMQTAQGPLTRHLAPYFTVAEMIEASFTGADRLVIHEAGAKLAGGHLRSQRHFRTAEYGGDLDDARVLLSTRNSNSMDVALLVQDLVPLLEAYGSAPGEEVRSALADAIIQGVSADPELLLIRTDLLDPYTTIEGALVERTAEGTVRPTPAGERHRALVTRYRALLGRAIERLKRDAAAFDPSTREYSPLGLTYGFCADILANTALETLITKPPGVPLEELFATRDGQQPVDYVNHSIDWARQMFALTMAALDEGGHALPRGRLFVVPDGHTEAAWPAGAVKAQEHCITSDFQHALATGATAFPKSQILLDRREARYLASAESNGRWFCVSKAILTACTSRGHDAAITGVPAAVVDELRVTCGEILEVL